MDDVIKKDDAAVAPYERGAVSIREVAKGVFARFLPASVTPRLHF